MAESPSTPTKRKRAQSPASASTPTKKHTRSPCSHDSSVTEQVALAVNTWVLPNDEAGRIMNYVLHHKLYRSQISEIVLVAPYAKHTAVYNNDYRRWTQAFPPNHRINVHWKGVDFEMERLQASARGVSLLPNVSDNDTLRISTTATIIKLNALIEASEEYEQNCIAEGIMHSISIPTEEGDTINIQNISPFVNMKDVYCPQETKHLLEVGMKNMESDHRLPGQPKRFVSIIWGPEKAGKTTLVRGLATSFKKKLVQYTCTGSTTAQDLIMLLEEHEDETTDVILTLRDFDKVIPSIERNDFDVGLFSKLINGILTPPSLYLVMMVNCYIEPKIKALDFHITHMAHVPMIKAANVGVIVTNIMKKRKMAKFVDDINALIVKSLDGKNEIKCGVLVNALTNYDDTQRDRFCKMLGQKSQTGLQMYS